MQSFNNTVMVWRWTLLPSSETFIRNQINSYANWKPVAVGATQLDTVNSATSDRIIFANGLAGKVKKTVFRVSDLSLELSRAIELIEPQVIHAHFAIDGMRMRSIAKRRGIPLVVTLHGSDITSTPSKPGIRGYRYRLRLAKLFRDADRLVAVSEHIANAAVSLGADRQKITVLPVGVPWKNKANDKNERRDIVFVGRLVEKKGIEYLLESIIKLGNDAFYDHRVKIIGDGPLRAELEERADRLGLPVDFLGLLPPQSVHEHMENAVALAVPSVRAQNGDTEGLPTVIFEAFRAGTPVVGFRHAGIPEAVEEGYSGLLVDERDVDGLAQMLEQVISEPSLAHRLGQNARRAFETSYEMSSLTKKLEQIYQELTS